MWFDKFRYVESFHPIHGYKFEVKCPFCGTAYELFIPAQGLFNYRHGMYVQRAFPELSDDEREMIKTGMCQTCQDELFKEREE